MLGRGAVVAAAVHAQRRQRPVLAQLPPAPAEPACNARVASRAWLGLPLPARLARAVAAACSGVARPAAGLLRCVWAKACATLGTQTLVLRCAGRCSSADCHAGWLACLLPCVAWAHNQHRAFAVAFVPQLALYLLLVYALRSAAVAVVASCELADATKPSAGCHAASLALGSSYWALASAFSVFAAWRRAALRRRFGLPGSACGDVCAWLCCPACALCQETRTLAHNRVEAGFWLGPLQQGGPGGSAYDDAAAYPYDYVPTSYGSPPPQQRAAREPPPFVAVGIPSPHQPLPPGAFIVPPPHPACAS